MGGGRRIWRGGGVEIRDVGEPNGTEGIVKGEGRHGHSRRAEEYSEKVLGETNLSVVICMIKLESAPRASDPITPVLVRT